MFSREAGEHERKAIIDAQGDFRSGVAMSVT
jgi:hypothetical protein